MSSYGEVSLGPPWGQGPRLQGVGGRGCCAALSLERGVGRGLCLGLGYKASPGNWGGGDAYAISPSGPCWYPLPTLSTVLSSELAVARLSPLPIARYPLALYLRRL